MDFFHHFFYLFNNVSISQFSALLKKLIFLSTISSLPHSSTLINAISVWSFGNYWTPRMYKMFMFNSASLFCVVEFLLNFCNLILVVCNVLVNLLFLGLLYPFFVFVSFGRFCCGFDFIFICLFCVFFFF